MCCVRVTTRVTTAQSIVTKVNNSSYVTIRNQLLSVKNWQLVYAPSSVPWVDILFGEAPTVGAGAGF